MSLEPESARSEGWNPTAAIDAEVVAWVPRRLFRLVSDSVGVRPGGGVSSMSRRQKRDGSPINQRTVGSVARTGEITAAWASVHECHPRL
jgi:hypothetical protein